MIQSGLEKIFLALAICAVIVAMIMVSGCSGTSFPEFPESVKFHYAVQVKDNTPNVVLLPEELTTNVVNISEVPAMAEGQVVRCMKFEIVSKYPYKIKFLSEIPIKECNLIGGYTVEDSQSIYSWMDDVAEWADKHKSCFK